MIQYPKNLIEKIVKNPRLRQETSEKSHLWFFHIYFSHYVIHEPAPLHKEIFSLTEEKNIQNLVIVSFRGSGKSTIMNMSYPIWSIIGEKKKKFVLIVGQTQEQARQHIKNLKNELENNQLLKDDFGPFEAKDDEWRASSIFLRKYGAQIMAVSTDQSIRGLRNGAYRPDLIICDDIEDLNSIKTQDSRDKNFNWLTGELIPGGDINTQLIMIGNLLHRDSVLMRMKDKIESGEINGVFKEYRLLDDANQITWPGKYTDLTAIEKERKRVGNDDAWFREYLLQIISQNDQVIRNEWIQYYDPTELEKGAHCRYKVIGVDLAISKRSTADYTAIVSLQIHGYGPDTRIFIMPNPVNERLTFHETIAKIESECDKLNPHPWCFKLAVESVGYQAAAVEELKKLRYKVEGITVGNQDKRARLSIVAGLIQSGKVKFPRNSCETLINQLVGFGSEKHDDLADALAMALLVAAKEARRRLVRFTTTEFGESEIVVPY